MKKVLIIAYYWPPAGGPGVQRWLKFVSYLSEFGVQPVVYLPENPTYPLEDDTLLSQVPENVEIIRKSIWEPYGLASLISKKKTKRIGSGMITKKKQSFLERLFLGIRGNLFIPDARKFWVKPSIKFLSRYIEQEGIQTIITTGPPHSLHLIGMGLKSKFKLQWIADFRDPWTTIGYHSQLKLGANARKKHRQIEQQVVDTADKLIVTSQTTKQEFSKLTQTPITVITNGYDGEIMEYEKSEKFTLSHIGSLLTGRNPEVLWKVLEELAEEVVGFKERLEIRLGGVISKEVFLSIEKHKLSEYTTNLSYVPYDQVSEQNGKSQVLLLVEIDREETRGIIPGKLFSYLKVQRPILAIGPDEWEAGQMVQELAVGSYSTHKQQEKLKTVLLDWFKKYEKDQLAVNPTNITQFHRRQLTAALADCINGNRN